MYKIDFFSNLKEKAKTEQSYKIDSSSNNQAKKCLHDSLKRKKF